MRRIIVCSVYGIFYSLGGKVNNMSLEGDRVVMIFLALTDIKMSKGQIAGRVADVTQHVIEECIQRKYITYTTWKKFHASQKIVLKVNSLREFYECIQN